MFGNSPYAWYNGWGSQEAGEWTKSRRRWWGGCCSSTLRTMWGARLKIWAWMFGAYNLCFLWSWWRSWRYRLPCRLHLWGPSSFLSDIDWSVCKLLYNMGWFSVFEGGEDQQCLCLRLSCWDCSESSQSTRSSQWRKLVISPARQTESAFSFCSSCWKNPSWH